MRKPFRVLLALAATLALPVLAQQGPAGRWNASVETPQGPFAFTFEFAVDAAGKLTGSMNNEFIGRFRSKKASPKATTCRSSCRSKARPTVA